MGGRHDGALPASARVGALRQAGHAQWRSPRTQGAGRGVGVRRAFTAEPGQEERRMDAYFASLQASAQGPARQRGALRAAACVQRGHVLQADDAGGEHRLAPAARGQIPATACRRRRSCRCSPRRTVAANCPSFGGSTVAMRSNTRGSWCVTHSNFGAANPAIARLAVMRCNCGLRSSSRRTAPRLRPKPQRMAGRNRFFS
jgi:hypothetical protein